MFKKFCYGLAFLGLWMVSVGVTAGVMNALRAQDRKWAPVWVGHPDAANIQQPTVLTKHELFSEDHTSDVLAIEQVWAAYGYYNDSHNGPGIASLFIPNAIVHFVWNNRTLGGRVDPNLPPLVLTTVSWPPATRAKA